MSSNIQLQDGSSEDESKFTKREANNTIRPDRNDAALIIEKELEDRYGNVDVVETVFFAVDRTYFKIKEDGMPAKCEKHTMTTAIDKAREKGHKMKLGEYEDSKIDIKTAVIFAKSNFETENKDSKASYGIHKSALDEPEDELVEKDDMLDHAGGPIHTSDERQDGW